MKLEDCREAYYYYTGKTSDILRQIGFVGLAIIWVFRINGETGTRIPDGLVWCGILLCCGLICDFLQYLIASAVWGSYHRYKENKIKEEDEFKAPPKINWPSNSFFVMKSITIAGAYILLIKFLLDSFWRV